MTSLMPLPKGAVLERTDKLFVPNPDKPSVFDHDPTFNKMKGFVGVVISEGHTDGVYVRVLKDPSPECIQTTEWLPIELLTDDLFRLLSEA